MNRNTQLGFITLQPNNKKASKQKLTVAEWQEVQGYKGK